MADAQLEWARSAVSKLLGDVAEEDVTFDAPAGDIYFLSDDQVKDVLGPPLSFEWNDERIENLASIEEPQSELHNVPMTDVTRPELDAKLEAIEARMDARVASIEGKIDAMLAKISGRDDLYDQRFASIEESLKDTKAAITNLKTTTIVTAISAVLAIVLGIAAFNATVLSNMVASFESGKNTAASLERTAQEMKALQDRLDKQVTKP